MSYTPRLRTKYRDEIVSKLMEQFQYKSIMQVPRIEKVCINRGVGGATQDKKLADVALEELTIIAGQKAVPTQAKKSVSNFKLREGMPIGCMVTLRRKRMYDFYYKLVNIALPRVRDFRGLTAKAMDGHGNYSLGIKEHIIFPEIDYDKIDRTKGLNISIVTTANTDEEGRELLRLLGMPFRN